MDPVSLTATVIPMADAVCQSYEQISKLMVLVRNKSKELEAIQSRAAIIKSLVANLQQALEESVIRKVIEQDEVALTHARALDEPLKAVRCTFDEVVDKLQKQYRPATDGKYHKIRWRYYLSTSDWQQLQKKLDFHIQVLSSSMQGLNTLNVLRILGGSSGDPARTLRTYAESILETKVGPESTLVGPTDKVAPLFDSAKDSTPPLSLDDRRLLVKKKLRLQRELLQVARGGDYLDVSLLLGEGVETEWTEETEGMTALHFAAKYGHIRVAKLLLEAGADIEAKCDAFGDEWIVRSEKGRTPLVWAAAGRDCPSMQESMCSFLIEMGADVNVRNVSARTPLQEAAMSQRYDGIDPAPTIDLLIKHGAKVNAYDVNGWTALTECAAYGNMELVEVLLAHGACVDGKPGEDGVANDGNPNLEAKTHETPLVACAKMSEDEELISLLLDRGADPDIKDKEGKTIADFVSDFCDETLIERLRVLNDKHEKNGL